MSEWTMTPIWFAVRGADQQIEDAIATGAPLSHLVPPPAPFSPEGMRNWQTDTWGAAMDESTTVRWDAPHGAIGFCVHGERDIFPWALAVTQGLPQGTVIEMISFPLAQDGERHALLTGVSAKGIETAINGALDLPGEDIDLAHERDVLRHAFEIYGYGEIFPAVA